MPDPSIQFNTALILLNNFVKPITIGATVAIILILVILIIISLVSAAESAFFALTPANTDELKKSNTGVDQKILDLVNQPKRLLATLLISVNFLSIAIVIINATFVFGEGGIFDFTNNPVVGFIIQVVAITFLIVFIGEVTPKIYATQNPLQTTRFLVHFVYVLRGIFYPISSFLIASTSLLDKMIKPKINPISVDDLSHALDLTNDEEIPDEDHKILQGIVKFGNLEVTQIMKSRMDITAFEDNTPYTILLKEIVKCGFSRIPIYKENLDNIIGVLYTKDLLMYLEKDDAFDWQALIRPPFYVPENKKIDDLLHEFQLKKIHLALIVDEYGGTSGIVTLEDIIEEIVGEINDEFEDDDIVYSKLDEYNYVFEGRIQLNDVFRITKIDEELFEEAKGDADTLAGLIIEIEGRIPKKNEEIKFKNIIFKIESADARKVKRVKVSISDPISNEA